MNEDTNLKNKIFIRIKEQISQKLNLLKLTLVNAVGDINEVTEFMTNMKKYILFIHNSCLQLDTKIDPIIINLNDLKEKCMNLLVKYSENVLFDKIENLFNEIFELINEFKNISEINNNLMNDLVNVIDSHKKIFIEKTNIKNYLSKLEIQVKEFKDPILFLNIHQNYDDFICKPIDNSNFLNIYDLNTKEKFQLEIENSFFFEKNYSFFDIEQHILYISGGFDNENNISSNDFYEIKFERTPNLIHKLKILTPMTSPRFNHSIIKINKNYLFVIGGNIENCDGYDLTINKWSPIPKFPFITFNPCLLVYKKILYVITGCNLDEKNYGIFKLNVENINTDNNGNINLYDNKWIKINYKINNDNIRFLRGMGGFIEKQNDILYILGGQDEQNFYENVYKINLSNNNNKNKDYDKKINEEFEVSIEDFNLPFGNNFNSNFFVFENYYVVMLNSFNNLIEFNLISKEFFTYE